MYHVSASFSVFLSSLLLVYYQTPFAVSCGENVRCLIHVGKYCEIPFKGMFNGNLHTLKQSL